MPGRRKRVAASARPTGLGSAPEGHPFAVPANLPSGHHACSVRDHRSRKGGRRQSSTCSRWQPQHRPRHPRRQHKFPLAHEGLEEFDQSVCRWSPAAPETKVVLSPVQPRAAEMPVGVGQAVFEEEMVDVHTTYLFAAFASRSRVHEDVLNHPFHRHGYRVVMGSIDIGGLRRAT